MFVNDGYVFGYWIEATLVCPGCLQNLGPTDRNSAVAADFLEGLFGNCSLCKWPLWGLRQYELAMDQESSLENRENQQFGGGSERIVRNPLERFSKERGLSKKELAKVLKTTPAVIGRVEAGKIGLPLAFIEPLQKLGCNAFQLFVDQQDFIKCLRERRNRT
jgi:hypothetical protein